MFGGDCVAKEIGRRCRSERAIQHTRRSRAVLGVVEDKEQLLKLEAQVIQTAPVEVQMPAQDALSMQGRVECS